MQFTRTDWVVTEWQTDSMAQAVGWKAKSRIVRKEITCLEVTWSLITLLLTKLPSDSIFTRLIQCILSVPKFLKVISFILIFKSNFVFYATCRIDCILLYVVHEQYTESSNSYGATNLQVLCQVHPSSIISSPPVLIQPPSMVFYEGNRKDPEVSDTHKTITTNSVMYRACTFFKAVNVYMDIAAF